MNNPKLSCRNVWKIYGAKPGQFFNGREGKFDDAPAHAQKIRDSGHIVGSANVSFDVHVGEIFVIMGLSGSGKSTMVRCLSRLVDATAGEVLLDGEDLLAKNSQELIEIRRHKIGMVFQNFGLMPHLNVVDNIAFPLKLQGIDTKTRLEQAHRVIELVNLQGRELSYPHQLSGGQQQRVGIARSLAVEPDLWLLDEPFSALDPLIRRQMQDEFLRIQDVLKKSIVFITHDFLEALRIADRMMIMRDGEVVQMGTPIELVTNPADDYVAEFTSDVPMVMVLRAGEVCEAGTKVKAEMKLVPADMTVEALLPMLTKHAEGIAVGESLENAQGVVTTRSVVDALAMAAERVQALRQTA